ncbi:hypothetical protein AVEN_26089-1 [Araneus ventricosus]|uniref:Uncharacterized protein n=1 Tax=Araneus ventricosus TaxID=182803 RepID=A0A4Y2NFE9_ARAVE|nr:hypothetical protein AVEN_26089-1 [Araneus ventricosus]
MMSSDNFLSNMVSSDDFLSNMASKDQPYSQRIIEISGSHRFLLQNDRKGMGIEPSLLLGRSFDRRALSNVTLRSLKQYPVELIVNEMVSLVKIMGLDVDNNDIDELVEDHSEELITEKLMELHCVSQQEVVKQSSSEEEVTAKQ